ncbi:MAG: type I DNA topoisomerase [Peptococcaceae bacterium]|nr:type I DNA topoisomerase [Peptococcaceae bacterium]
MAKTLVIVESPAKAKSIGKILSRSYQVNASMGHLRDLPKSQMGVDIANDFEPKYIAIRGRGDLIKKLRDAAKNADKVLLAADPDREGEAISWHLAHLLGLDLNGMIRVEFNEITKTTVQNAIKNPRKINMDKVDAQQARRVLDRLVGYTLGPLLWRKVKKGLSAGRVQSVAVRLICDREDEIRAFEPEEYWSLLAHLAGRDPGNKEKFTAKLLQKAGKKYVVKTREEMDEVLADLGRQEFVVKDVKQKEKNRQPAPPFTTSSLQQEAFRKLNFAPKKTMMIAQQLYEGLEVGSDGLVGLITYMRTDSVRVSDAARDEAKDYINQNYAPEYYPAKPRVYTSKGRSQDAHETVRPTSVFRTPEVVKPYLSREQFRLYNLIWSRFIASQMQHAVFDTLAVDVTAGDYLFRANASMIKFPGFLAVYEESTDDAEKDPVSKLTIKVEPGQKLTPEKFEDKQHFTEPPPRYTEASLVKKLEDEGIGRPSTYAPTIETIQSRGYVVKEQKRLMPTELGEVVDSLLTEHFADIVDLGFTAHLEEILDTIEEGKTPWKDVIRNFYDPFEQTVEEAEAKIGKIKIEDEVSEETCEHCGRNMVIKMGRYGKFLACPGFPECRNAKSLLEDIGVACPLCGQKLTARRSKKGRKFFGCSGYPGCEFVSWDKPVSVKCPQCDGMVVEKTAAGGKVKHVCTVCKNQVTVDKESPGEDG